MPKKFIALMVTPFLVAFFISACAKKQGAIEPTNENFKDPVISLELVEVPQYDGYWYYGNAIAPTKGTAGDHGAPLPMAITFNITNPNPYPVLLDGYQFTIAFDGFDVVTANGYDTQWIPGTGGIEGAISYSNQLRATTMITTRSVLLNLGVTAGFKLQEQGINMWDAMEKWWTTIGDMAFPILIYEGGFTFKAGSVTKTLPFKATYPK
ncbi:MAG TPA: hypothetical protein VMW42_03000 [Desulfatiglandales bacterium]|nr:hypothetical protein [Desulfatiglandales bacterium]